MQWSRVLKQPANMFRQTLIRQFHTSFKLYKEADFTHVVIGAGSVGLAVAYKLTTSSIPSNRGNKVLVIERNESFGQEISSRNSEVVHAGLYYPPNSLKTELCISGKEQLYSLSDYFGIKKCGKWIVAQNESQMNYLEKLHEKGKQLQIPTKFVDWGQAKLDEPLIKVGAGVLESSSTGIIDSHGYMEWLVSKIEECNGELVYDTNVVGLSYDPHNEVYEIETRSGSVDGEELEEDEEKFVISSNNVINAAGLGATDINNLLLPEEKHLKTYYAKGNYFALMGLGNLKIKRLIYPCPDELHVKSLGTHLTIDMGGQVKFGPDLEWIDEIDYHVNDNNLNKALTEIQKYLPIVKRDNLVGVYSGIRPKLIILV
ncbi:unnamed protein product [Ambrosiozyma monospora]|uniref:L-2-hydroxyglutarate dehydrogenase, mitochondrial n=1 Tax=Ambrosiozyma monospora TaxID=43982 RepID=A0A9W6YUW5_AMBMO|nr:unnamed protein product [Ambrosiozyma monospora]